MPIKLNSFGSARVSSWPSVTWRRWLQSHPRWSPAIPCVTWVFFWTASWRWMLTSSNYAVPASTSFEGCGSFGIVCREDACWPLRARSFAIGLTIATASSVELLRAVWIAYSPSWTLRRDSSSTFQSFHTSRWPSVMSFTGFQSSVALNTKSVSSCETALSVRRRLIYRNSASLSPPCWVVSIFDLLAEMTSIVPQFRTVNYMDCAVSQFQVRDSGTHCLMTFDNQLETWTFSKINLERVFFNCNSVTSASADPRHEWRFIKCPFTLHYITIT